MSDFVELLNQKVPNEIWKKEAKFSTSLEIYEETGQIIAWEGNSTQLSDLIAVIQSLAAIGYFPEKDYHITGGS